MRPIAGDEAFSGRSRSTSFTDNATTPVPGPQPPQMTYFIANERTLESSSRRSSLSHARSRESMKRSNFGVESLDTTTASLASRDNDDRSGRLEKARSNWKNNLTKGPVRDEEEEGDTDRSQSPSPRSSFNPSRDLSPSESRRSVKTTSRPFTPLNPDSPFLGSIKSSPSSRRNSEIDFFTDDAASQAIISSGEDEKDMPSGITDSGSASQLVMPSISMPSRRPFTEKGKNMGKLKVLIAGDSGIGKTSLIKAIVQICEDIVHVDPLSSIPLSTSENQRRKLKSKNRNASSDFYSTSRITEVYASTRAYPYWWSDFDDGKVMKRRKSSGDSVLERNVCFVDTPGYSSATSCIESITPVIQYIESHLQRSSSLTGMSDEDMMSILSGNGGSLVDVVFYLIPHRIKPVDIEYLRRLSALTNIIPLVARADTMSPEELQLLKSNILSELRIAGISQFTFGVSTNEFQDSPSPSPPYAISTATTNDEENMDASLLMSSEYVQPLMPTELATLVGQVFDRDSISWLRYSAAKKCLHWLSGSVADSTLTRSIPPRIDIKRSFSGGPSLQIVTPPIGATNTYALARITDHTQREERLAQVRLSKWAIDLQRSLQNERARFEALAQGERAVWLTERLNECVQDGTLVPKSAIERQSESSATGQLVKQGSAYSRRASRGTILRRQDPLGLVQLNEEMKRRSWAALQIVGSFGIIGGLAIWLARSWHTENETLVWGFDWTRLMIDW